MHIPVLLKEVLAILDPKFGEFAIDGTFGAGGHAQALIERVGSAGKFIGIDWNPDAALKAREEIKGIPTGAKKIVQGNYADIPEILAREKMGKPDVLLLDLGLSSDELETSGLGFSFQKDEPLDMRYDPTSTMPTAADVINQMGIPELEQILREYGEERYAGRIARVIVETRRKTHLLRTNELVACVQNAVPRSGQNMRRNPATRTFQALRIYVNHELENLERVLAWIPVVMQKGGRVGIITFHSLEDRIVKNHFRNFQKNKCAELLTKKPIAPTREEQVRNPRSRSAKLRSIKII